MTDKIVNYTIGTLIKELPEMNCRTFIDVFLEGDVDYTHNSDLVIDVARAYAQNSLALTPSITKGDLLHINSKLIYQEGGYEGDGEYLQYVIEFTYPNGKSEFIAIEGIYNSYDSNMYEYHKPYIAKPVEKTITVWEAS